MTEEKIDMALVDRYGTEFEVEEDKGRDEDGVLRPKLKIGIFEHGHGYRSLLSVAEAKALAVVIAKFLEKHGA
jgi:hypothetical protein